MNMSSLGLIELESIAKGYLCVDQMLKKAPVDLFLAKPFSSGKFIVMITGDVASVDESMKEGCEIAGPHLLDHAFIPAIHEQILPAISGKYTETSSLSSAIMETSTVVSAISALDRALKTSAIHVSDLKLGSGIGGKAYFIIQGELSDVEASVEEAKNTLQTKLIHSEIIPRPFLREG